MPTYNLGSGNDTQSGTSSADTINGNAGDDTLFGLAGNDILNGGDGNDVLDGGPGNDTMNGGNSFIFVGDTVTYASATSGVTVSLAVQTAQNTGGAGIDTIIDVANIRGSAFNDTLTGTNTNYFYAGSRIYGGAGDDTLIAGTVGAQMEGGPGNDTLIGTNAGQNAFAYATYTEALAGVSVSLAVSGPQNTGGAGTDTLVNIGGLIGSAFNDVLTGAEGLGSYLFGGEGDDLLVMPDNFNGGSGNDTVSFAPQSFGVELNLAFDYDIHSVENIIGTAFNDVLSGTDFANRLSGGGGDDLLAGALGDDVYDGGEGRDAVSLLTPTRATEITVGATIDLRITTGQDTGHGHDQFISIENIFGTPYRDVLTGNSADNYFTGEGGDDELNGGEGDDSLMGYDGADLIRGGPGDDYLNGGSFGGGAQIDTVSYDDAPSGVTVSLDYTGPQDTGGAGVDTVLGFNVLVGSAHGDRLTGQEYAASTLRGLAGSDQLIGGRHSDVLEGGEGLDVLRGNGGNDTLDGGAGSDTAIFSGARSAYSVSLAGLTATVTGPDGTDTLTGVEFLQFDDVTAAIIAPGADPDDYMAAIRDFDGNNLGGENSWVLAGSVDIQGDGDVEHLFFNAEIGRWASVGPAQDGLVYFSDHGWGGDTRVVGIYIDPLVESGEVIQGSDHDSQRRFQNDLFIGNINEILGGDDYDGDGLQEVYFALTDGTAYLHAYMHADGNIRYANYQSEEQVIDFLTSNGYGPGTYAGWFGADAGAQQRALPPLSAGKADDETASHPQPASTSEIADHDSASAGPATGGGVFWAMARGFAAMARSDSPAPGEHPSPADSHANNQRRADHEVDYEDRLALHLEQAGVTSFDDATFM